MFRHLGLTQKGTRFNKKNIYGYQINVNVNKRFVRPNEIKRLAGNNMKLEACIGPIEWAPLEDLLRSFGSTR